MTADTDPLVILDGTAMVHKCYHAVPSRPAPDGAEVGAVLAVCSQLVWLLGRMRSRHLVMAFDPGGRVFRHDLCADYKGHRRETPDDLRSQLDQVRGAVDALGIPTVCVDGFEADDCIATLTARARDEGVACWMVGIDKDLYQLVTDEPPAVRLFVLKTRTVIDEAAVQDKIGVPPRKAVDYFALVGDTSDNISGVKSVGTKAAATLLQHFDSLEDIYADLHAITGLDIRGAGRLPMRLLAGRADAEQAREMVRLRVDVPLGLSGPLRQSTAWRGPTADADAVFAALGDDRVLSSARDLV
jgi:DNA polymerase-1